MSFIAFLPHYFLIVAPSPCLEAYIMSPLVPHLSIRLQNSTRHKVSGLSSWETNLHWLLQEFLTVLLLRQVRSRILFRLLYRHLEGILYPYFVVCWLTSYRIQYFSFPYFWLLIYVSFCVLHDTLSSVVRAVQALNDSKHLTRLLWYAFLFIRHWYVLLFYIDKFCCWLLSGNCLTYIVCN